MGIILGRGLLQECVPQDAARRAYVTEVVISQDARGAMVWTNNKGRLNSMIQVLEMTFPSKLALLPAEHGNTIGTFDFILVNLEGMGCSEANMHSKLIT